MLTRRDLLRLGLLGGGGAAFFASPLADFAVAHARLSLGRRRRGGSSSPPTTPFAADLPIPPEPNEVPAFATQRDRADCAQVAATQPRYFHIIDEEHAVQVHPDLPPTRVWRYRDSTVAAAAWPFALGPTFKVRMATGATGGAIVRHTNALPPGEFSFGVPRMTVHLHGGHQASESDGFPNLDFGRGEFYDYCYPMRDTGFSHGTPEPCERPSTLWYHDHFLDFTAPNVYRGLAGFYLVFDELDSGNELTGLGLPSGPYDIPLALQDKRFVANGSLVYDTDEEDGFLGDKFLVNGVIQPRLRVKKRKYRFRLLNASNARFYRLYVTKASGQTFPFDQIATDGGLLAAPIRGIKSFQIAPAERVEIVLDFRQFSTGDTVFLENRLEQDDGRGPDEVVAQGTRIMQLIVEDAVADPSKVPDVLRPCEPIPQSELNRATRRTFEFDRSSGWTINGRPVHIDHPVARPKENAPEIWHLINKSGGWSHPVHVHLDFMRILRRNGQLPPLAERDGMAKKDTIVLGPNQDAEAFIRFRDFPGRFVFHCHNLEHEDRAMMAVFDVVPSVTASAG